MAVVELTTIIVAPVERVFDLARSIEAHLAGTTASGERVVGGRRSGLIELNEEVTWEARHFGFRQRLTARITAMDRPKMFVDEMVSGAFKRMRHTHEFSVRGHHTEMRDLFDYAAPLGVLGRAVERLVLDDYMRRFLLTRNAALKEIAESDRWREYLGR